VTDEAAASAAEETATVDVWVDYNQYYVTDIEDISQALKQLSGRGLLAVVPGLAAVYCGTHLGPVHVTIQVHQVAPPLDLVDWEDVVEISFTAPNGQTMMEEWGGDVHWELPNLTPAGPGTYRLRLHTLGRDRGREEDSPEEPVERHLLAIWPASPAPEVIHKLASQAGQAEAVRAAQAAEEPARSATAEPAFEPPPAAAPQDRPVRTTAITAIEPTVDPPDPPGDRAS
jgi:hypothetical protein